MIRKARDAWLTNEADAAVEYCNIADWDVPEVTELKYLFDKDNVHNDLSEKVAVFNADLSSWDTSIPAR